MKAHFVFFSLAFLLVRPAFSQNGYTDYPISFKSGLSDLPQQALDSQTCVLGTREKKGVFSVYKGWVIPMMYDSIYDVLSYRQPDWDYVRIYNFYKVKSGKFVGLFKCDITAKLLIETLYDSISCEKTKYGPIFIAYRHQSRQYFDPFAERWIESKDDYVGLKVDMSPRTSLHEMMDNNMDLDQSSYKHTWSKANFYRPIGSNKNYSIFYNGKLFGVVRKSDSIEIVHARYSSIVPIGGKDLRFQCMQNDTYCILDTLGKLVVPAFTITECVNNNFKSYCIILANGKYGLYLSSESILVAPEYSGYKFSLDDHTLIFESNGVTSYFNFKTQKFENRNYKNLISSFENRYILAEVDSVIQLIDRVKGKVLKNKKYVFSQTDIRNWALFRHHNKHLLISLKTNSKVHLQMDSIELIKSQSKEVSEYAGFCYLKFNRNNLFGVMDSTGKVIVEPIYDSIHYYSGWDGHDGKFTLWRYDNSKTVMDAYFVRNNIWVRDIESAYRPGKGLELANFIGSNDVVANIIKIREKYHLFDKSTIKIGKPVQIDSILFIGKEGCWIVKQNGAIVMWYLDKDSIIDGITDFKVLKFKDREVIFLKQGNVFHLAFTDSKIHQLPQIDEVYMPHESSFLFALSKHNKLALFSPNAVFSNFIYDDVKVGFNELIWVKMDGEWMVVRKGLW